MLRDVWCLGTPWVSPSEDKDNRFHHLKKWKLAAYVYLADKRNLCTADERSDFKGILEEKFENLP
jgi:hypothetical protein